MIPRIGQRIRDTKRPTYLGEVVYVGATFARARRDDGRMFQVTFDRCQLPGVRCVLAFVRRRRARRREAEIRRLAIELGVSYSQARVSGLCRERLR